MIRRLVARALPTLRRGELFLPFNFKLIDGFWGSSAPEVGGTIVGARGPVLIWPPASPSGVERRRILAVRRVHSERYVALLSRPV